MSPMPTGFPEVLDAEEIRTIQNEVNNAAQPFTILALMWLVSNPDADWAAGPMREGHAR